MMKSADPRTHDAEHDVCCLHDAHCHLQLMSEAEFVRSATNCCTLGVCCISACATHLSDWKETEDRAKRLLQALRKAHSPRAGVVVAYGCHPYRAKGTDPAVLAIELEKKLNSCPFAVVGEIGLDKSATGLEKAPLADQEAVCLAQLQVALRFRRPVVLHCVRAQGALLELLSRAKDEEMRRIRSVSAESCPSPGFCGLYFHSWNGSPEGIRQCKLSAKALGCSLALFGFPAALIQTKSKKLRSSALACSLDDLLIETDAPD